MPDASSLFRFDDPWELSVFTQKIQDNDSIFKLNLDSPAVFDPPEETNTPHFDFKTDLPILAGPPTDILRPHLADLDRPLSKHNSPLEPLPPATNDDPTDIWTEPSLAFLAPPAAQFRTWATFSRSTNYPPPPPPPPAPLLSEAGPATFDAYLTTLTSSTSSTPSAKSSRTIIPHALLHTSLLSLATGHPSPLFHLSSLPSSSPSPSPSSDSPTFVPTHPSAHATGLSPTSHASLCAEAAVLGERIVRLREFARGRRQGGEGRGRVREEGEGPVGAAVRCAVGTVGDVVEAWVMERGGKGSGRSLLRLGKVVREVEELVRWVCSVVDAVEAVVRDEEGGRCEAVVKVVADRVAEEVAVGGGLADFAREFLAWVSRPWLDRIMAEVGLGDRAVLLEVDEGDELEQAEESALLGAEDRALVEEAKVTMKLLRYVQAGDGLRRRHSMDLSREQTNDSQQDARIRWTTSSLLHQQLDHPRESMAASLVAPAQPTTDSPETVDPFDFSILAEQMSSHQPHFPSISVDAELANSARRALDPAAGPDNGMILRAEDMAITSPFDKIRPAITAHVKRLSHRLLNVLFNDHALLEHFAVHRSFHLLGNGDFITRLNTALFSTEAQTAERKRGTLPTAEVIGLRLGAKQGQRWPPASSELQLSLMGILTDVYSPNGVSSITPSAKSQLQLPGDLNFAIRELPEAEIERTLDADSIYALDFLKLHYTPPSLLSEIFTTDILSAYDSIFRVLLPLLRLLHVTSNLKHTLSSRRHTNPLGPSTLAFANLAHHFVTTVTSHFMDTCIAAPWHDLTTSLHAIAATIVSQVSLNATSETSTATRPMGLSALRTLHETCLDRIRRGLFLKTKQSRVRAALEAALDAILRRAQSLATAADDVSSDNSGSIVQEDDSEGDATARDGIARFVDALRGYSGKVERASGGGADGAEREERELGEILLARLAWRDGR